MYEIYEYKPNYVQLLVAGTTNQFFIATYSECDQFKSLGLLQ